jgi:PTH1 family peptidyl-tRNA hydrolase
MGLGNPGSEYEGTRHNAGFLAVDLLTKKLGRFTGWRRDGVMLRAEGRAGRHQVAVIKPQTYMNRSGDAFRDLMRAGWIAPEILVALDDVYLPLGSIRLRGSGGTGGHQGLESIRAAIGTDDLPRRRIGVGPASLGRPSGVRARSVRRRGARQAARGARGGRERPVRSGVVGVDAGHEPLEPIRTGPG